MKTWPSAGERATKSPRPVRCFALWDAGFRGSRRGDSNPRPSVYETLALPLSYVGGYKDQCNCSMETRAVSTAGLPLTRSLGGEPPGRPGVTFASNPLGPFVVWLVRSAAMRAPQVGTRGSADVLWYGSSRTRPISRAAGRPARQYMAGADWPVFFVALVSPIR